FLKHSKLSGWSTLLAAILAGVASIAEAMSLGLLVPALNSLLSPSEAIAGNRFTEQLDWAYEVTGLSETFSYAAFLILLVFTFAALKIITNCYSEIISSYQVVIFASFLRKSIF